MKLLIISHTPHYRDGDTLKGWGATVRELDHLAALFEQVVHVAPLYDGASPDSMTPYQAHNLRVRTVKPSGGQTIAAKTAIFIHYLSYLRAILEEIRAVDAVHVRCPANISLLAILLLAILPSPKRRWIKYAGNWQPAGKEPASYRFQRWWLKRNFARAQVTVNGQWADAPPHVHAFLNPCLTEAELSDGRTSAHQKQLTFPLHFLFVGRIEAAKGIETALEIIAGLRRQHLDVRFDLVGDGAERSHFEGLAQQLGLGSCVQFHGWMPRDQINPLYRQAHFVLFPSATEGFPKVISEAMAYGVVPLAGSVSSIPQVLAHFKTGRAFPPTETNLFINAILQYVHDAAQWKQESASSFQAAQHFTYNSYLVSVKHILGLL